MALSLDAIKTWVNKQQIFDHNNIDIKHVPYLKTIGIILEKDNISLKKRQRGIILEKW